GAASSAPAPDPRTAPPANGGDAAAPSAACKPPAEIVQRAIDSAVPADINAVAMVRDPACGARFFTHGPGRYTAGLLHGFGSNTKMYVASIVLMLLDEGRVSLDAPIGTWIAGVPGGAAIRVRHLLQHTSGLYDYTNDGLFE